MRFGAPVLCAALLGLAGLTGLLLESSREEAGIVPSPARIPLGGFEPLIVDLLHLRADAYLVQGRLPEAVAAIRMATELQPRVPDHWAILGHLLAWETSQSSGDPEVQWRWAREGLEVMERGLEHNPDSPALLLALGQLYLLRVVRYPDLRELAVRDLDTPPAARARDAFRRCMEVDPSVFALGGYAESCRVLGIRLGEQGDREGALRALRAAREAFSELALDPETEAAAAIVDAISERIRGLESR